MHTKVRERKQSPQTARMPYPLGNRWRPYRVECTRCLPTSEVKRRRAWLVLGWGTAWEDLKVLSAFLFCFALHAPTDHACATDGEIQQEQAVSIVHGALGTRRSALRVGWLLNKAAANYASLRSRACCHKDYTRMGVAPSAHHTAPSNEI